MKINIICIGTLKEKYWRDALGEYIKRMTPFADMKITELKECRGDTVEKILAAEEMLLRSHIHEKAYKVALCIEGKSLTSPQFAKVISRQSLMGKSEFVFIIGSSHGLSNGIKDMCDMKVSFSDMTFPHQLFRVMLTEQIYRAFTIINNTGYHK